MFATAGDPVGSGIVASLAHPGGNITGLSSQIPETAGKRLEFLREFVPRLRQLAILSAAPTDLALDTSQIQRAARTLDIETRLPPICPEQGSHKYLHALGEAACNFP